jgi:hypothetical protein
MVPTKMWEPLNIGYNSSKGSIPKLRTTNQCGAIHGMSDR